MGKTKFVRDFYMGDPFTIARSLLGSTLYTKIDYKITGGKIVELEVYHGISDKASHAYGGKRTSRNEVMYRKGGVAYIYLIYGLYSLFNIVTGKVDSPNAILIRALEPVEGIDLMRKRRRTDNLLNLASGPGKLCSALNITREQNGIDLTGDTIWVQPSETKIEDGMVVKAKRIGINYAEEYKNKLWRFYIKDNPYISNTVPVNLLKNNHEVILKT